MTAPDRPQLTHEQAWLAGAARAALEASRDDTDPETLAFHCGALEIHVQRLLGIIAELTGETPAVSMCAARVPGGEHGGFFTCTLGAGHGGRHEAHGASPLPVWGDGDTAAGYDEGGAAEYIDDEEENGEGQYRNRMACGDSLWDEEQYAEGAVMHCPRHGATVAITELQWLAEHPAEPIGFIVAEDADDENGGERP